MNVFYLGGYANDVITTENLKKVNHYIQEDSTLRASIFGETIKDLYAISGGRSLYISKYGNEQKERYEEVVVDSFTFSTLAGEFFNKLQSERATYKSLKKESEILENLEERYPDLASLYMAQVDSLCELVQNKIDVQNSMLESLKRNLAMDLRIHEINKKEQYIAIEKKVKYPTSLPGTLFSCTFSGFIVSLDGQDTLIRNLFFKMESSEGIRSHSSEMVHHKYDFYQPIIGLESYQYRFAVTLYDANVDGIDYLFDYEFTPKNLPFNALYLEDVSYVRPVKPTGDCPYLLPFNDHIKRIEERFYQDVLGRLQENGHSFFLGYRKLGKAFVK